MAWQTVQCAVLSPVNQASQQLTRMAEGGIAAVGCGEGDTNGAFRVFGCQKSGSSLLRGSFLSACPVGWVVPQWWVLSTTPPSPDGEV